MKRALVVLLIVVLSLPGLVAVLAATAPGTRLLFATVHRLHPAFRVRTVHGTLLGHLRLDGVRYHRPELDFAAATITFRWRPEALWHRHLHITELALERVALTLPPPRETPAAAAPPPSIVLPFRATLERLAVHGLRLRQGDGTPLRLTSLSLGARFDGRRLTLVHGRLAMADLALDTGGRIALQGDYPLRLRFQWRYRAAGRTWRGNGTIAGDLTRLRLDHRLAAPLRIDTHGTLSRLLAAAPGFDLRSRWTELTWPPAGRPAWRARDGRLHLHGTAAGYRVRLTTRVDGATLPETVLELQGEGDPDTLRITRLTAHGAAGELELHGRIGWRPQPVWQLALRGRRLDPGAWLPDWPGRLTLSARTRGRLPRSAAWTGLRATVEIDRLQGSLRGQPLEAGGRLRFEGDALQTDALRLDWGDNRIELQGRAGRRRLDLGFRLRLHQPQLFVTGLGGHLDGAGRLTGTPGDPDVRLHLRGHRLTWPAQSLALGSLRLQARLRPDDPGSHLRLEIRQARLAALRLQRLDLSGHGSLAHHRLRLTARIADAGQAVILADGGYRHDTAHWQGRVQQLPLAMLGPLLPEGVRLAGGLSADFTFRQRAGRRHARLHWRIPRATLSAQTESGPPLKLRLADGHGRVRLDGPALHADLVLPFPRQGRLQGRLQADLAHHALDGALQVGFTDLHAVEIFVPQLQAVRGRIAGELRLGGVTDRPRVTVALQLTEAGASLPATGITIDRVALHLDGDLDQGVRIRGSARSAPGTLRLDGRLTLTAGPQLSLAVRGKDFTIAALPTARVRVSPRLEVHARDRRMTVTGEVRIPYARIAVKRELLPQQTPEMVSVSRDEIVVGRRPAPKSLPFALDARVALHLGDVRFKGYGIDTALAGALHLRQRGLVTRAEGEIRLVGGRFDAYGQKLKISRGRFIFSGPVDNPLLDLHIVRQIRKEGVTVEMAISGFADDPQLVLRSSPPLADEEILAYLLTGRGLRGGENRDMETALAKAAAALGITYLNRLGLSRIAQVAFEENTVLVGRRLLPDLYVGYAVDVFTGLGEAVIRYRLYRNLVLEARSGQSQSVAVDYTLETD